MKPNNMTAPSSPMTELPGAMKNRPRGASILFYCALALVWAGCTTQQQQQQEQGTQHETRWGGSQQQQQQRQKPPAPPPPVAEPAVAAEPAPALKVGCSDPTWGLIKMAKTMPAETTLGGEFATDLSITAQSCAANVVVLDKVPDNATYVRSEPAATVEGNQLTWNIGDMEAGQTIDAKVWFKATKEGTIVNCATVSADPRVCGATLVVNPAIELTKTATSDVIICDPIPMTLVVKNAGSAQLTGVKVTDNLPEGLLTSDGQSTLAFDAGTLAPGESKEFKFNATAARTGTFVNAAEATSNEGVSAKASASTAVHQAVLAITCEAREQQYMGRPFNVCLTVSNSGDTPATGSQVVLPVPSGLTFNSATAGGKLSGNNVVWDLGALAANSPQQLCATFTSTTAGTFAFNATAKGACAAQVSTACQTTVIGISALLLEKADDPDPIQVGETTTYTVKVTNQGTADDTNIKMVVEFPSEIDPVSASNGGVVSGKKVTFPAYPRLAPKQAFEYTIVAKGVNTGDARVKFIRTSDGIPAPTSAEESTRVY